MKHLIYLLLISFIATFCTTKNSNESTQPPVKPTDEQIEQYLQKRESEQKKAEESVARKEQLEFNKSRQIANLLREKDALSAQITLKSLEMEREHTRLLRRYLDDTIVKWTSEIERDRRRIAQIIGLLKKLGYSEEVGIPKVNF